MIGDRSEKNVVEDGISEGRGTTVIVIVRVVILVRGWEAESVRRVKRRGKTEGVKG